MDNYKDEVIRQIKESSNDYFWLFWKCEGMEYADGINYIVHWSEPKDFVISIIEQGGFINSGFINGEKWINNFLITNYDLEILYEQSTFGKIEIKNTALDGVKCVGEMRYVDTKSGNAYDDFDLAMLAQLCQDNEYISGEDIIAENEEGFTRIVRADELMPRLIKFENELRKKYNLPEFDQNSEERKLKEKYHLPESESDAEDLDDYMYIYNEYVLPDLFNKRFNALSISLEEIMIETHDISETEEVTKEVTSSGVDEVIKTVLEGTMGKNNKQQNPDDGQSTNDK